MIPEWPWDRLGEPQIHKIKLTDSAWRELAAALHPADRMLGVKDGDHYLVLKSVQGKVIFAEKEKGKMNQDFEDQKLATVSPGFDSVEDEQSWLQYLDGLAATHEAEMLERLAADSAYEERKLEQILNNDNF